MLAVLVLEMQKDIILEGSPLDQGKLAREIIPNIKKVLSCARQKNIPIIYGNLKLYENDILLKKTGMKLHCLPGTMGIKVVDQLKPEPNDYIVDIFRMNAFLYSNLEFLLNYLKVSGIFIVGVSTDIGCLLTAMEAFQRGFDVMIVSNCCAAKNSERHERALNYLKTFIKIVPYNEVLNIMA